MIIIYPGTINRNRALNNLCKKTHYTANPSLARRAAADGSCSCSARDSDQACTLPATGARPGWSVGGRPGLFRNIL